VHNKIGLWRLCILLGITVVLGIIGSVQTLQAEDLNPSVIKIGATYPLSGSLAAFGRELRWGAELAVDIINNEWPDLDMKVARWKGIPSLGGAKVEVVIKDDRAEPSRGADLTEKLIKDEKVVGMIGCYASSVTKTASTVAERYGVPFLNAASTSPTLTKRGYEWFWRSGPTDERNMQVLFDFFDALTKGEGPFTVPKAKIDNIAVASENTEFGSSAAECVVEEAAGRGYTIDKNIFYPHGSPDLTSEVQALLSKDPDVIVLNPYVSDAILLVRTMKSLKATPTILASNACVTNPDFPKTVGKDAVGMITMSGFVPRLGESIPLAAQVDRIFYEKYGGHLSGPSARVFVALQVWAEVLNKAGSTDPLAIQKAFNEIEIPAKETIMNWGVKFYTTGEGKGQNMYATRMLVQYQMPEGEEIPTLEIIYPFDLATANIIFPFPGWGN